MSQIKEIIKNQDGDEVNVGKDIELAKLILEITDNKPLLSMLFGYELSLSGDVEPRDLAGLLDGYNIIKAIKSIVNMAFIIAMSRWKQLCDNKDWTYAEDDYNLLINSRYSKLFQSGLNREEITLDLQIFALTELWVNLKNPKCSIIKDEFGIFAGRKEGETIGVTLQQTLDFIKNATFLGTNNEGKYNKYNCNLLCIKLLRMFPFFEDLVIELPDYDATASDISDAYKLNDREDFLFVYRIDKRRIKLYPNKLFADYGKIIVTGTQLMALKRGEADASGENDFFGMGPVVPDEVVFPHMLVGASDFNGNEHRIYRSFDGSNESVVIPAKDNLKDDQKNGEKQKETPKRDASVVKKFMSFNYKNIRQFALVISDAIQDTELPQELIEKFIKNYKKNSTGLNGVKYDDTNEVYLDYIITLMLVEMGPSEFLEQILGDVKIYSNIMDNIGWRCIGRKERDDYEKNYQNELAELKKQYPRNNKQYERCRLELRVSNVVKAMGFYGDVNTDTFEESLSSKFDNISDYIKTLKEYKIHPDNIKKEERDNSKKGLREVFKDMFIFMNVFYCGVDAYAKTKEEILKEQKIFGGEKSDLSDKDLDADDKIKIRRKRCTDSFIDAGAKRYAEIKDYSLTEAYESFCDLCRQYNTETDSSFSKSEYAERLKFLITRNYICDVSKLEYYAAIYCDGGKTKTTIFHMLENYSDKYYEDPHFVEWLDYFKDVFFFLIYNDDYYKRGLFADENALVDKDCDPVYPYMVNYHRENTDRDNLKKCTYRVPVPVKNASSDSIDKGFVVNLLTEEHYPPMPHFCIPLKYGSTDNWWINPFMVPKFVVKEIKKKANSL